MSGGNNELASIRRLLIYLAVLHTLLVALFCFSSVVAYISIRGHFQEINESIGNIAALITMARSGMDYVMDTARENNFDMRETFRKILPADQNALVERLTEFAGGAAGAARAVRTMDELGLIDALYPVVSVLGDALSTPEASNVGRSLADWWEKFAAEEHRDELAREAREGVIATVAMIKEAKEQGLVKLGPEFAKNATAMLREVLHGKIEIGFLDGQ